MLRENHQLAVPVAGVAIKRLEQPLNSMNSEIVHRGLRPRQHSNLHFVVFIGAQQRREGILRQHPVGNRLQGKPTAERLYVEGRIVAVDGSEQVRKIARELVRLRIESLY